MFASYCFFLLLFFFAALLLSSLQIGTAKTRTKINLVIISLRCRDSPCALTHRRWIARSWRRLNSTLSSSIRTRFGCYWTTYTPALVRWHVSPYQVSAAGFLGLGKVSSELISSQYSFQVCSALQNTTICPSCCRPASIIASSSCASRLSVRCWFRWRTTTGATRPPPSWSTWYSPLWRTKRMRSSNVPSF